MLIGLIKIRASRSLFNVLIFLLRKRRGLRPSSGLRLIFSLHPTPHPLTPTPKGLGQIRKLVKTIKETDKKLEQDRKTIRKFLGFQEQVFSICISNRSKKATLAQALKELQAARSPLEPEILKLWHPKRKAQGYSLVKGSKKHGNQKGGTYL